MNKIFHAKLVCLGRRPPPRAKHGDLKTEDGRQRVVRHGHLPEREVMTGIGLVAVR